ncbi:MAG TPA: dienelactone hydrolase family protein, partial [Gemmataceae bacterium]|nr:dienelactone hydrolase family protein [Gemmataceae bacterium]
KDAQGNDHKYVLFIPHSYDGTRAFPVILFLHGAGETGKDGRKQVRVGLGPAVKAREKHFPFIVVFPQSEQRTWHADSADGQRAIKILEKTQKEYNIDPNRVILTGLSMGGFGTWSLAARYPKRWAAIVPICGGGNPATAARIKDIPCWCFHGGADPVVPTQRSRDMIAALRRAGGHPTYTEYPGVGHNSWDRAYATEKLYPWLRKQHRS